jgi:V8-like Glu-specific endopeptidase
MSCILFTVVSFGQLRVERQPRSFDIKTKVETIPIINIQKPDMQKIEKEDLEAESMFKIRRFGVNLPVHSDLFNISTQIKTAEGTIYIARFVAEDAEAITLYSDKLFIPEGGELYLYTSDKAQVIGAFTSLNNNLEEKTFATELLFSDNIVIEYFQPEWQKEQAIIEVSELCYAYRDVSDLNKASGSCNVNVNCSEGDNWRQQQKGVCRIQLKFNSGTGWCSGTLMNNTSQDKKPYILTAAHCVESLSLTSSYFSYFVFYFDYESASCTGSSSTSYTTLTGCSLKALDTSYSDKGSDFCLLLMHNTPTFNTYWCGWSRETTASQNGVGIHHPNGDIKKISTYNTALVSDTYQINAQTHWKVLWKQTTNGYGVTEQGSSGSALFNSNGLVVGTLSGGYSACTVSNSQKTDWYGKMSYHWTSNGNADNLQLKPWLDPANTGATTLNGNSFSAGFDTYYSDNSNSLFLYPNPASQEVTINLVSDSKEYALINIINSQGKIVYTQFLQSNQICTKISLTNFTDGLYLVQIISGNKRATKKLIVNNK